MITLVCFVEEESAKEMLGIILKNILSNEITHKIIAFEGKQDLGKQIERKLRCWNTPNSVFLIMRDQDSGDCKVIKQDLLEKVANSGKKTTSVVRIACRELESFYLGDLQAVEDGLKQNNLSKLQNNKKFRDPDRLNNAKEELEKISKGVYQEISGSRSISTHLKLDGSNKSTSFNVLLSGIRDLTTATIQQ